MAYWRLFYHFVWTTRNRKPSITDRIEPHIYRCMQTNGRDWHVPLLVIGGTEDHIHVLAAVRPAIALADFVKQLKGSSSHLITHGLGYPFEWQEGYGVFSVSETDVPKVIRYVENQKQHHAKQEIVDEWVSTHHWNMGPKSQDPWNEHDQSEV